MAFHSTTRRVAQTVLILLLTSMALIATADSSITASGTFIGQSDHVTTGGVSILKTQAGYIVVLESDFSLDGAPDPKIGFGSDGKFASKTLFTPLNNKEGLQVYEVPKTVKVTDFNEIYIWCEKFNVPLGVAKLK